MAFSGWAVVRRGLREDAGTRVWLVVRGSFAMWDTHEPTRGDEAAAAAPSSTLMFCSVDRGALVESLCAPPTRDDFCLRLELPDQSLANFPSGVFFFSFGSRAFFEAALAALNAAVRETTEPHVNSNSDDGPRLYERTSADSPSESALVVRSQRASPPLRVASLAGRNHNSRFLRRSQPPNGRGRAGSHT